ncbi:AAC(3) family N-acetyltransferase [Micromonospora sp. NPDC005197]|uniref:AAC(3) family N-acetyltransferase n=1 Tax=unclassified Micromonospora TaxID=2617518 RepID=UPI0033A2A91D
MGRRRAEERRDGTCRRAGHPSLARRAAAPAGCTPRLDAGDFGALGRDLEATGAVRCGPVGAGTGRLVRQRAAVDFAVQWMARNRTTEDA